MSHSSVDEVIADTYSAATGRIPWARALLGISEILKCLVVQVVGVDLQQRRLTYSFDSGGLAEAAIDYARSYHQIDPHAAHVMQYPAGTLLAFSRVFDQSFIDRSPFYQDFLIPYGSRHMHGALLHATGRHAVMLGIHRAVGQSALEGDDWLLAQRLCFHMTHAAQIYEATRRTSVDAVVGTEMLNRLGAPVMLITAGRQVLTLNNACSALLAQEGPLRLGHDGYLQCRDVAADAEISRVVRMMSASIPNDAEGFGGLSRRVVRVSSPANMRPLLACFIALRTAATMGAFGDANLAMLVVHDPNQAGQLDPFQVAAVFELTPAEARVAVALATGASPQEISKRHGVSLQTVRTQVRAIYSKLEINRVAELTALLQSVAFGALR